MSIAAVILAAGSSRRLGRPKQTVELGGEVLMARAARIANEAGFAPVIVVVNPDLDFGMSLTGSSCTIVVNEQAEEGIASSIRRGVEEAKTTLARGVVLMTCDQIAVTPGHLRALCELPEFIAGSGYAGKIGVPAYFPASCFHDLLALQGDMGARDLLRTARTIETEDLAFDIDTEEDLARVQALLTTNLRRERP